jgi:DNA-binding LacI/PurR family transcriptional regulator
MNIIDVAKRAKVSPATVSRVLNGNTEVNPTIRSRVQRAIEQLNYYPNLNARVLSERRNRTLGVVVSNLDNPYFLDVYRALEEDAQREGFELLVANTNYVPDRLVKSVRQLLGRRVAGLAAIVSEMEPELVRELKRASIPVVISGVKVTAPHITNIKVNCRKGMQRIVDHLHALGHRRMVIVDHHSSLEGIGERRSAFLDGISRLGSAEDSCVLTESDSFEGGRQAVRDLIGGGFQATAIVCVNDRIAIGVLKELHERGIRVPEDISVTGFDNIAYSEYIRPALTTADIPRAEIGRLAFQAMIAPRRSWPAAGREIVVDPELVVRESTGPSTIFVENDRLQRGKSAAD